MERAFDADFTQGGRPLPRPRRHRRAAQAVVRDAHARRGRARRSTSTACAGARTRRSPSCSTTTGASSPTNPVFGDVDHPGIGTLLTPASPLRFPTDPPYPPAPAPLLGMHTDEVLDRVLGLSPAEIGTPARRRRRRRRSAARFVSVRRAHPRRRRLRRPGARRRHAASRRRASPACLDADPAALDHGHAPAPVALGVLPPRRCRPPGSASTVTRADGPRWTAFPQRMWVGGRVQRRAAAAARRRRGALVAASSGPTPKDGGSGRFWLVTVGHVISQDDEVCIDEEQDLVFRERVGARATRPRPRRRARRAVGGGAGRRPGAAVPVLGGHRQRAPHPLRPAVRDRRSRATPTSSCTDRSPRSSSPSSRGDAADRDFHAVSYRARAPHFANHPFWLTGTPDDDGVDLAAVRADHTVAMTLELR